MNKSKLKAGCGYGCLTILLAGTCFVGWCIRYERLDHARTYETKDLSGTDKDNFVHKFVHGVTPTDILHLDRARTGGRDQAGLARATFSSNGFATLRAASKLESSPSLYEFQSATLQRLQNVEWWDLNPNLAYEVRRINGTDDQWTSLFYIPTNENPIYILTYTF